MDINKLSEIIKNSFQAIKQDMDKVHSSQQDQIKAVQLMQKELDDLRKWNNKVIADILRRLARLEKGAGKKKPVQKVTKKKVKKKASKKKKPKKRR